MNGIAHKMEILCEFDFLKQVNEQFSLRFFRLRIDCGSQTPQTKVQNKVLKRKDDKFLESKKSSIQEISHKKKLSVNSWSFYRC